MFFFFFLRHWERTNGVDAFQEVHLMTALSPLLTRAGSDLNSLKANVQPVIHPG